METMLAGMKISLIFLALKNALYPIERILESSAKLTLLRAESSNAPKPIISIPSGTVSSPVIPAGTEISLLPSLDTKSPFTALYLALFSSTVKAVRFLSEVSANSSTITIFSPIWKLSRPD